MLRGGSYHGKNKVAHDTTGKGRTNTEGMGAACNRGHVISETKVGDKSVDTTYLIP